jgi:uncharacterized membrane protein
MNEAQPIYCAISGQSLKSENLQSARLLSEPVFQLLVDQHPNLKRTDNIDRQIANQYQIAYIAQLLEKENGKIEQLDQSVLNAMKNAELIAQQALEGEQERPSIGERLSDQVAAFGGSWRFILAFLFIMFVWITINVVWLWKGSPFDPYPFILLNLILSCIAALQAPVIMMSQNRQEVKDRKRAENDYQINLKAEIEIRLLHEKLDHMLIVQNRKLIELLELLNDAKIEKKTNQDIP